MERLLLVLALGTAASVTSDSVCASGETALAEKVPVLLQTKRAGVQFVVHPHEGDASNASSIGKVSLLDESASVGINPSGAGAPLTQEGYAAVSDRCCQAEMQVFIARQVLNLNLEVCDEAGLRGIVPYHSCALGPLTFDKLTIDILADSVKECTWVAPPGDCKPKLPDCPNFTSPPLADCSCNRSKASKIDLTAVILTYNNLGGVGPNPLDPPELRYSSGISSTGEPFELVVTPKTPYATAAGDVKKNGLNGAFGRITVAKGTNTDFTFSFMVPGTNIPVTQPEIHMTMFDLDGGIGVERSSAKGYSGYVTDASPSISLKLYPDGRTEFGSSANRKVDQPFDPNNLDKIQRRHSVMYFFKGVKSFDVNFGVEGGGDGRSLFFAFESMLNDRCSV